MNQKNPNAAIGCMALLIVSVLVFFGILIAVLMMDTGEDQAEPMDNASGTVQTDAEAAEEQPETANTTVNWSATISTIAASNKTETEKFDEVMILANDYSPSQEEVTEFEQYLVAEFTNGSYLADIKNHDYMLGNIFKAEVVADYYADDMTNPMGDFSFDFLQNTKYTYRGVDAVDSQPVMANEEQMKKSLADMGN
ncbi:hypothetical protein BTO30_14125 [Domibacillus antri]|uniref:Uncharacterized protein n=1 Tax=Domibacillus antri TaxID=1714264 RepID=A0A1Q8Q2P9_9BACI|nr:hypothetical protein [Domibacillus antri]OLN21614.1 hypothetical protein BTO30_14125 [Domibacillus antri]